MSSQSEDQQSKRNQPNHASSPSSDTNNNHQQTTTPTPPQPSQTPPPPQPPPANNYPPAMGYPPQMMYSNGGPYPGYPPPPHGYNQYAYAQPPPPGAPYYTQDYATPPPDRCSGFARGVLAAIFLLVVLTCLSSLITWAVLRPQIPVFHVDSMSVSNFNTSTPFTATFDTNLTVENPNHKLRLYFDKIVSSMFYDEDDLLGSSWLNPVFMETKTKTTINAIISANGTAQNAVPIWVTQEISKDRATGSVSFALRFRIWATFKSGSWWTRSLLIRVLCEDLKVNFVGASGNGALAPAKRDNCNVYT